jgi:hypothetical protein
MKKYAGTWRFIVFAVAFLTPISLAHIAMILKENGLGHRRGGFAESYLRGLIDGFDLNKPAKQRSEIPN